MDDDEAIFIPSPLPEDDDDDGDNGFVAAVISVPPTLSDHHLAKSPRRKRARYVDKPTIDNVKQEKEKVQEGENTVREIVRDATYYFSDGSCILRVEDTLFNVHRSILSRDSSSFSTMFTLPQGEHAAEGSRDETPIVLAGDTPAEFRHFLWALYALPPELMIVHSPLASLTSLIDIARVSNKYSFKSLETWALDAVQEYVNRKPSPILASIPASAFSPASSSASSSISTFPPSSSKDTPLDPTSTAQLTSLVRLAVMCEHPRLLGTMVALLRQLMGLSLQYAYLAMTLADELDLRQLRGAAYLEVMQKAIVVRRTQTPGMGEGSEGEGAVDEDGRLIVSPDQQLRLLSGYYRLTGAWERLRSTPPEFGHASSCGATWHQHGCTQSWLEFWKEKTRSDSVLSLGLADVLGRLKAIAKEFDRWGSATYMHHDCRMAARRSIQERIKGIEEALPDYFGESDG